jgi:predicted Zn-dependent peptidase
MPVSLLTNPTLPMGYTTAMTTPSPYTKTVLSNGVRLMLVPMAGVESAATAVMVGVGSRFETPEINGISHFLEHMVFKGTAKYPTTDDVNFIERLGGLQNAYTDIDITNYHNKVLATDWREALEINKELAVKPRLEQQYVDKERDVILEEMKRYEDEPEAKVGEAFHSLMYPGTRLGMRIIGEEKPLRTADAETLRTYHDRWYAPENMVVVVAGRIVDEKAVTDQVTEWFAGLPKGMGGTAEAVKVGQTEPKTAFVTKPDAQQAHINLGLRVFPRGSDDRYAWNLFNLLFGVSFTSRLFREIREKRGLCYHVRSSTDNWSDAGYWSIYAGVATVKVPEAVQGIMDELKKAADNGVTDEEVAIAKKRLKTMMAFRIEDPEFLNEWYGRQELFGQPIMTVADYLSRVEQVGKADIDALIRKYIRTETLNLAVVWNKPEDASLRPMLTL